MTGRRPAGFLGRAGLLSLAVAAAPTVCAAAPSVPAPDGGVTRVIRLASAPFPYDADPRRREPPFFTARDPKTGEGMRTIAERRFRAGRHYADNRVLIHLPPGFDPAQPMRFLVFFHGHLATLARDVVGRYAIPRQVTASGRNVVLIAPQLARDAVDSHPGKLVRQNGLAELLADAANVVARETGMARERLARAPVILAGFSAGNVAVVTSLEKGGIGSRIAGVILLDALYDEMDRYAAWFARNDQRAFLAALYGASTARNTDDLMARFRDRGVPFLLRLPPGGIDGDDNLFLRVDTPHLKIPVEGPPPQPVAEILRRLPPFAEFAPVAPGG